MGFWDKEKEEYLRKNYLKYTDKELAEYLDTTISSIAKKRLRMGLKIFKKKPYINESGYIQINRNGKRTFLHRKVAEDKLGRKLKPGEVVHHVNGNKTDNSFDNLYVCKNKNHHGRVHNSLENIAFELLKKGIIGFNEKEGEYYIKKETV